MNRHNDAADEIARDPGSKGFLAYDLILTNLASQGYGIDYMKQVFMSSNACASVEELVKEGYSVCVVEDTFPELGPITLHRDEQDEFAPTRPSH